MENENSSKRKKMPPSRSVTVESINAFPDDVLTHILSFLPTKEAFRTSVLSKRWFPLCYSLSVLYFNDEGVNNSEDLIQFRQFMDAVMFSPHSQHLTLNFLYLRCFSELWDAKADCFDKWVEAAKRRCVKVLDLRFPGSLAPIIFCCKTLVVLNLREIRIATVFHCSVDLPLLKTLYLIAVSFEDQEDFMKFLSGCPKLEDLKAGLRVKENAGVTPRESYKPLSNLIVASIWLCQVPLTMVYNVQYLSVYMFGKSLSNEQINSYYKGFPVFGNLTKLHLNCSEDIHDWGEVVKMLQNCPKLQNLEIEKCYYSTTIEDWEYPDHVPECVSSHLITCKIKDYEAVEVDFRFVAYILQNARLLQVMTIFHTQYSEAMENPQFLENLSSCPRISPACKLSLFESN